MPSMISSSIGLRLFTALDDGTGHAPVENLLDAWLDEGIANTPEILKALDLGRDGRVNLGELTSALENELLVTRNGLHQAALASFKTEIRHLLDRLDLELQEKERILLNLEKVERLKSQLAAEVDENHSVIERTHHLKLRKLEQEHKERLGAVRSELLAEMDQIQQQAALQRDQLEAELEKTRADESFMRDHLSISIQENRRLEMELLDGGERLAAAEVQNSKLQASLENILREKFGDLDPGSDELFRQEERIKQLCSGYEAQCRELQDRIDELQSERTLQSLGRRAQQLGKPLGDELESNSPGVESDPGLGTEETQPITMSLEAEMMLEQLKEQHGRRVEDLQAQLESTILELDRCVEEQRVVHEAQKASISSQHQEEVQAFREQMSCLQSQAQDFQAQLEQARLERMGLERRQAEKREELELQQEEEVASLRQRLLEAHTQVSDLEEQLAAAAEEAQRAEEVEELKMHHALELKHLQEQQEVLLEARLEEERMRTQEEAALLQESACKEKERLGLSHGVELSARLEEAQLRFEEEKEALVERLTEEWRRERAALEEQSNQTLQEVLEAGMLRLVKEQEEKESRLREQLEEERVRLQKAQEEALLAALEKEHLKLQQQQEQREKKLKEAWEEEKLQLEEDYEGMLQDRLKEEREKVEEEKEKEEKKRFQGLLQEQTSRLVERHREEVKELSARHREEREELRGALDRLREEVIQERSETSRLEEENVHLSQKITELKAEDLKGTNADLLQKLENFQKERTEADNVTENFQNQISDLRAHGHHLQEENVLLSQKNIQNSADLEEISQQLAELIQENKRRDAEPAKDKLQMDACVATLEAEVTTSLEEAGRLEERNVELEEQLSALREKVTRADAVEDQISHLLQERRTLDKEVQALRSQLARAQEKVETLDGAVQTSALQTSHLKSDLRISRQEKDALHHEALSLHKQLRNTHNKVQILELAFRSGGFQEHKKLYRQELSLLNDQEEKLLKQENQRLQAELLQSRGDLEHCRVKVHQLETATVSLKQQNHSGRVAVLEQENASLKKQLEEQNGLSKQSCGGEGVSHGELESLRQENEVLKARLSTQLIEAFQAQLVGLLPASPHRAQRAPHRGEEPDNVQDERERKMKKMEERMREIEMTLHNVKLLLRDKVAQLKDQLRKNGKADVMIQDLYVENSHLLKALQQTEQQQQMVEKKNYLLEQKISSLSKIMRDLSPCPLSPASHHSKRS